MLSGFPIIIPPPMKLSAREHAAGKGDRMEKENRGVTLNSLLEEQRALNMRMLLAVQLRDEEAQKSLRRELEEVAERIERLLTRRL